MTERQPLIILGASARAAARSALRGGYQPWCVDLFADLDLQRIAPVRKCPADQYPYGMLKWLEDAPPGPVLITGALENHPQLLQAIEHVRSLRGSGSAAIAAVRDPAALAKLPAMAGIVPPRICASSWMFNLTRRLRFDTSRPRRYLLKPRAGAGGAGIGFWSNRHRLDRDHYLQRFIEGESISAVYHADGWSARLLGVTRQVLGDERFGVKQPFQYCGSIGPIALTNRQKESLAQLGVVLTQRFDLRGVFGVDAVLSRNKQGDVHPVEVNPRYTASVEIIERATGIAALHPEMKRPTQLRKRSVQGKAIVFARSTGRAPDMYELFEDWQVADVPEVGSQLSPGRPVCTVFAAGRDESDCLTRLHQLTQRLYTRLRS